MHNTFVLIFVILCASLINFASSQTQDKDFVQNVDGNSQRIRKIISVGDEFPALSIGLLNNSTEYEIYLNTSNHKCENRYKCDMYIYLTDMMCTKSNRTNAPFLEIDGLTSTNQTVCEKWCRDKASLRTTEQENEAAEFLPARRALIKPMGDWTNTNATISILALFAEQQPLETTILTKEKPSTALEITNSSSQHNFFYDAGNSMETEAGNGNVSLGLRLHMICTGEKGRNSTDLQVIAILSNNQTTTINVCADSDLGSDSIQNQNSNSFNVSGYLTNIQQVYLTPVGEWETSNSNSKPVAHILVDSVFDVSGENGNCPSSYFDCDQIRGCEEDQDESSEEDEDEDENLVLFKNFMSQTDTDAAPSSSSSSSSSSPCVPMNWVTNEDGVDTCNLIKKYCPNAQKIQDLDAQDRWAIIFKRCVFYYAFFIIPVLTMLIMVFGTAYYIKMRQLKDAMKENEAGQNSNTNTQNRTHSHSHTDNSRTSFPTFSIFHKYRKDVSYHTLEDVAF